MILQRTHADVYNTCMTYVSFCLLMYVCISCMTYVPFCPFMYVCICVYNTCMTYVPFCPFMYVYLYVCLIFQYLEFMVFTILILLTL